MDEIQHNVIIREAKEREELITALAMQVASASYTSNMHSQEQLIQNAFEFAELFVHRLFVLFQRFVLV